MKYFWIDVKKLYRSRLVLLALIILLVIAVIDPITMQSHFAYQSNPFMWWLFMNRTTGSTIFNTLYWLFPVLLTGLVFLMKVKPPFMELSSQRKSVVYISAPKLYPCFLFLSLVRYSYFCSIFFGVCDLPIEYGVKRNYDPAHGNIFGITFSKKPAL